MEILAAKQEFRTIDESQPAPFSDSKTRKDAYQTVSVHFAHGRSIAVPKKDYGSLTSLAMCLLLHNSYSNHFPRAA